jgi:para-nitrobenzyl esterase
MPTPGRVRVRLVFLALLTAFAAPIHAADQVKVTGGLLEGTVGADPAVRLFKGIPFAAPPVGDLRWRAPQAVAAWTGVRQADKWGGRCM